MEKSASAGSSLVLTSIINTNGWSYQLYMHFGTPLLHAIGPRAFGLFLFMQQLPRKAHTFYGSAFYDCHHSTPNYYTFLSHLNKCCSWIVQDIPTGIPLQILPRHIMQAIHTLRMRCSKAGCLTPLKNLRHLASRLWAKESLAPEKRQLPVRSKVCRRCVVILCIHVYLCLEYLGALIYLLESQGQAATGSTSI